MFQSMTRPLGWRLPGLLIKISAYVFVGAAMMLYINYPALQDFFQARARREAYADSVASLKKEYTRLLQEQAELKDGGFEREKTARERLNMVKPGEQILFIDAPGEKSKPRDALSEPPKAAEELKESIAPKEAPAAKQTVATPAPTPAAETPKASAAKPQAKQE